jgi:hypothetical protein
VCENGTYEANGGHPIPGRDRVDFAGFARAAGYRVVFDFSDLEIFRQQIGALLGETGPVFVDLKISASGPGRQRRRCGRPQRADPLQDLLGHGDCGQDAEKEGEGEGSQGRRGRRNLGQLFEFRGVGESDQRGEEFRLQVSVLIARAAGRRDAGSSTAPLFLDVPTANATADIQPVWHPRNCQASMRDYHG